MLAGFLRGCFQTWKSNLFSPTPLIEVGKILGNVHSTFVSSGIQSMQRMLFQELEGPRFLFVPRESGVHCRRPSDCLCNRA
jgi:hypothetical protein